MTARLPRQSRTCRADAAPAAPKPRLPRRRREAATAGGLILIISTLTAACFAPREPITVGEGMVVVENRTRQDWRNVRIVVNDHFAGGAPSLAAGGRLNAPLSGFQTGFGQKFDRSRMSVRKVEVTATDSDGNPVKLTWGGGAP